jgi:hypothetical protein
MDSNERNDRVDEESKKYQKMIPIPLLVGRLLVPAGRGGVLVRLVVILLLIFVAQVTKSSHAFLISSHGKYSTRKRPISTSRNNLALSSQQLEDATTTLIPGSSQAPPPKNPIFQSTNVVSKHFKIPSTLFLDKISPKPMNLWEKMQNRKAAAGKIGVDVTVEFRDAKVGATTLVEKCLSMSQTHLDQEDLESIIEYITNVLSYYQKHIQDSNNALYKVRLVSTVGSKGQKCPRWHVDHVPLRLVMSLAGAGCVYIPLEKELAHLNYVNRNVLNGSDEADTARANELILPHGEEEVAVHAKEGDAVLLTGRAWEETTCSDESQVGREKVLCLAAPHRSPTLAGDELRVLLVADYVSQD